MQFQGQMSGDDLSAAYASGDVFMMPSESETLGFVALEAMASGLPVVAVAAGGLTDILTNPGVTGQYSCCSAVDCSSMLGVACLVQVQLKMQVVAWMTCLYAVCILHLQAPPEERRESCMLSCLPCAGFLYPPSDYAEAARITADLLASPERRQAVGAAARQEVERWGWLPATQQLREQQYLQAIRRNRNRRW